MHYFGIVCISFVTVNYLKDFLFIKNNIICFDRLRIKTLFNFPSLLKKCKLRSIKVIVETIITIHKLKQKFVFRSLNLIDL